MNSCPRVVVDTNIVLSALIFGGKISRLRFTWQKGIFIPLVSKATITELIRVLAYNFSVPIVTVEEFLTIQPS